MAFQIHSLSNSGKCPLILIAVASLCNRSSVHFLLPTGSLVAFDPLFFSPSISSASRRKHHCTLFLSLRLWIPHISAITQYLSY